MRYIGVYPEQWAPKLGIDLETQGLDLYSHKILSVAIYSGGDTYVFYYGVHDFSPLFDVMEDTQYLKVFQNGAFDIGFWNVHFNRNIFRVYDTMLAEAIIDGGRGGTTGLKDILAKRLGIYMEKDTRLEFVDHPGFDVLPPTEEQFNYICLDVEYLIQAMDSQLKDLVNSQQIDVAKLEMNCVNATAELETGGISFDVVLWYEMLEVFEEEISKNEQRAKELIQDFTLIVPAKSKGKDCVRLVKSIVSEEEKKEEWEELNFSSPIQFRALLQEGFGLPVTTTGKEMLEELAGGMWLSGQYLIKPEGMKDDEYPDDLDISDQKVASELAECISSIRKWTKRRGFDYPKYINSVTGKIHPSYWQLPSFDGNSRNGAGTGRYSCSNPNMQQVPRPGKDEPNMRHLFTADSKDYLIIRADYAQQEPRIYGQISGGQQLIEACNSQDVYLEVAKRLYNNPHLTKKDEERQVAKMFMLAVGYGSGPKTLSVQSRQPLERCTEVRDMILNAFPEMQEYIQRTWRQVKMYGYVTTLSGRRRYIEENDPRAFTTATNSPIQGSAADMFKMAMSSIYTHLTNLKKDGIIDPKTRLWNIVHDEIEVHVHTKDLALISELVKSEMEKAGRDLCPDVIHIAELEYSYTWDK